MENNEKDNKNKIWIGAGVLAIVLIVGFIIKIEKSSNENLPAPFVANTPDLSRSIIGKNINHLKKLADKALSYEEALEIYKDRRIQLNSSCEATPSFVTYKNNTDIMIDNRSAENRTINNEKTKVLKPYDFTIISASSSNLPTTLLIDCGSFTENVATIWIQK